MKIGFCGHRDYYLDENRKTELKNLIENLILSERFIEFYLGGNGKFDYTCLAVLKELKKSKNNFEIVFVTPYLDDNYLKRRNENGNYDKILYPPIEKTPKRFAIEKRNNYIVDNVDLIICYVEHKFGGAYKMYKRAINRGVKCYNLA